MNYSYVEVEDINNTYDLIIESGLYSIIHKDKLSLPKYGIIGFHETALPEGIGHAPIHWSVLNNKVNLTITLYKLNEKVDSGDIIYQYNVGISNTDTLDILEEKRKLGIIQCFKCFMKEFEKGYFVYREQSGQATYYKKRVPNDSLLDCTKSLINLWDKIRICDNDKYPAYFIYEGKKIILRYEVTNDN